MACTTKSILPHFSLSTSNTASMVAGSVTSQWPSRIPPSSLASGSTLFFSASPCQVSAISAPAAWQALAIPHAIERLLATPRPTPRLPRIRPEFCAIRFLPPELDRIFLGTPALHRGTAQIGPPFGLFTANLNGRNSVVILVLYRARRPRHTLSLFEHDLFRKSHPAHRVVARGQPFSGSYSGKPMIELS